MWIIVFGVLVALLIKFYFIDGDVTLVTRVRKKGIEDKVIWITGASRGIGEILAQQLASLGAKLILSARNESELERVKSQLIGKNAPDNVKILPLDLSSSEESLKLAVEKAQSFFSGAGVDFMIHNAAYDRPKSSALEATEETLKAMFNVNVFGAITLTRFLANEMVKRGSGHFVVVSSAAGKVPAPGQTIYSASKAALNGYFHSLRAELFQKGIKVTVVCPGPIETATKDSNSSENRLSSERCAELIIRAFTNQLKEVWISRQPVLLIMYLCQYVPSVGFWLMDKIGDKRVKAATQSSSGIYSWRLLFGKSRTA